MIILTVLKIIGIVILCILALALLIILTVLFLPFRYKIAGDYDSDIKDYRVNADIRWLFGLLKVYAEYNAENGLEYWAKLFGRKIFPKEDDNGSDDDDIMDDQMGEYQKEPEIIEEKNEELSEDDRNKEEIKTEEIISPDEENGTQHIEESAAEEDTGRLSDKEEADSYMENEKKSIFKKISEKTGNILAKVRGSFQNIYYKIESLCDKIKEIKGKIGHYKELLEDEETIRAIKKAWSEIKYFARKIKPSKLKINLVYGASDPSETGIFYGRYAALAPVIGKNVVLNPDFERKVIKADIFMKGGLQIYVLILIACRLYFDKRFMRVVKKFRR
ncbi:hypothetical protein QYZ88_008490 [Lachnospiraceae bacterium C1.1]|nr:hypothetical protein [Lachnospiraceae bacterium C1.1]